jgi:hypothetical protein
MPGDDTLLILSAALLFLAFAGLVSTVLRIQRGRRRDEAYLAALRAEARALATQVDALERRP